MAVVMAGAYMVILDLTVLGVAIPTIGDELGAPVGIDWIVTAYVVAVGVVQPGTGWIADKWGKKRAYMTSLVVFALGSLLAGLSPSLEFLIFARVVQGLGGGLMMPIGMAMVYELFPPERRGTALGVWGVAMMAAPALGPPLGGWLTDAVSWRWIFLVNIPIGAVGLVLAARLLKDIGFRQDRSLDVLGWVLAALGIVAVVAASRFAGDWGLTDPGTISVLVLGVGLIAWLVVRSLRRPEPIIEFRMFKSPAFSITLVVVGFLTVAQFARLTYLPVELQVVRGLEPQEVGLMLAPGALGVALTMTLGGWLADRIGARIPIIAGLVVLTASTWYLANLTPQTSRTELILVLFVSGIGTGLALMPNTVAAMASIKTRYVAEASAVRSINRELAAALGTAILAAFVVAELGEIAPTGLSTPAELSHAQDTYNTVFSVATLCLVASLAMAFFLPGKKKMDQFNAERAVEHRELVASQAVAADNHAREFVEHTPEPVG